MNRLRRHVPLADWLPGYPRGSLVQDAIAGLSVWALVVPQSLAYATLAGVPVQYGLYTAFAALVAYALFGRSHQLVQGPSAAVCAVSAAVITPIVGASALGSAKAVEYTAALALVTGVVYLALGVLRMGWVSTFLSKAVMAGFVLGFAIGIVIDQAHTLLGVEGGGGSYAEELWNTIEQIPDTQGTTLAVGAGSLGLLLVMRRLRPRWPRMLIVVTLAIAVSSALDLRSHGVAVTGEVPTGLFSVGVPDVDVSELFTLFVGALAVVFVGYSETLAAARSVARKHGDEVDADQELIAQGAACGAAGLVGGFASDGSLSKTSVADAAGQRSQVASLINAALILLTMLLLAGLFETLPGATLGAVVIDAMIGLITLRELRRYFAVNRADWVFAVAAGVGILCLGITQGILIGVVLSLLLLVWRSSHTSVRELRPEPSSGVFHDATRHDSLEPVQGVLVARVDGPLFFADADHFRAKVHELTAARPEVTGVVVDTEAIFLTDTDGADILSQVARELAAREIAIVLAAPHPPVLDLWSRAGVLAAIGDDPVQPTVGQAVEQLAQRRAARPTSPPTSTPITVTRYS